MSKNQQNVSLKQRVWTAVKNEPGATAARIAKILEEPTLNSVSPALNTLKRQGYIYSYGKGYKGEPKRWYTDQDTYVPVSDRNDLVLDKHVRKVLPKSGKSPYMVNVPPRLCHSPSLLGFGSSSNSKIDAFVNGLTMGEANTLYDRLHGYFGNKKQVAQS